MLESQYTNSFDGTRIAYRVYGNGSPTVFLSNGIGCNQTFFKYLIPVLAERYQVVVWDYRGHVDSDIPSDGRNLTVDCCVRDMLAVMDAAGFDKAVVGGFSMGVQISLEFYAQSPERVLGLLPMCGPYGSALKTFLHIGPALTPLLPLLVRGVRLSPRLVERVWRVALGNPLTFPAAKLIAFNKDAIKRDDFELYRPHIANIDLVTFLQTAIYLTQHSAAETLAKIDVPTLVVAGTKDNFTPISVCRRMAEMIPGAEWFQVEGGSHGALIEFPDEINKRVTRFLAEHF